MYGVAMFISVDHRQWDRHSVTHKCDGHCVSCDFRERVQGRHPWLRESGDRRLKNQTTGSSRTHQCFEVFISYLKQLPSWDVANYLNVVSGIQRGGVCHPCSNDHLKNKLQGHQLLPHSYYRKCTKYEICEFRRPTVRISTGIGVRRRCR